MTVWMKPTLTDDSIEQMEPFEAFRYAEELLDSRFPREAARVVRPVTDVEPRNAAVWELLGRAHFAAAHLGPAEQAFRTLIELEPTSAWAHTALALALDRQTRRDEGAVHHRLAAAMGANEHDATRVELVDRPAQ